MLKIAIPKSVYVSVAIVGFCMVLQQTPFMQ